MAPQPPARVLKQRLDGAPAQLTWRGSDKAGVVRQSLVWERRFKEEKKLSIIKSSGNKWEQLGQKPYPEKLKVSHNYNAVCVLMLLTFCFA